nr:MAG TPA: hypothetical protein [Caudoviricetes sp.]
MEVISSLYKFVDKDCSLAANRWCHLIVTI